MENPLEPFTGIEASRKAPRTAALPDRLSETLARIGEAETLLELLEREVPVLEARLYAASDALIARIVEERRGLVLLLDRLIQASPRKSLLRRDGPDLIWHLTTDLEERFGVDVRALLPDGFRADPEEDEDDDSEPFFERASERLTSARSTPRPKPGKGIPDPEATAKGIYRSLARELHPDKTRDEDERLRRTELMQRLTRAWQDRDMGALLKLLHAHGSDEARDQAMDQSTLASCLQGLEDTLDALQRKLKSMRHTGTPSGVVDWLAVVRDPKLFEKILRRTKAVPREELESILRCKAFWSAPGGLERFLREVPEEDWPSIV